MTERHNRLIHEKSPYLLQHATNPVDWHPWGEEAFTRAREEERPIFLSIGYSTCHWCHVMERESFEDPEVARLLNGGFISIKVDREERPDVDSLYMTVCQMLSGSGGWPLTIVMTPEREPFFAGTYFPKRSRHGRIGMLDLLPRLAQLWVERREDVLRSAADVTAALLRNVRQPAGGEPGREAIERAYRLLAASFDELQGGFGKAPKFPTPHNLTFLLRYWHRTADPRALDMVETTLRAMRRGGIYDHVGFGFHRYSTDSRWLLPHFEKMLYDQALLVLVYTEAWQATRRPEYERTAREIIAYVFRDLTGPSGAFLSAEDADSEGVEGKFYLWQDEEIKRLLGEEEASLVKWVFNVERAGNFADEATGDRSGANILHLRKDPTELAAEKALPGPELERRVESARRILLAARQRRVRPHLDDKILVDWNGLMIAALANAARTFGDSEYAKAAARAADFLRDTLRDAGGRLLHRYRDGEAAVPATADDHAFLAWGLLELYEATYDPRWLRDALHLARELIARFWDAEEGGLFQTATDAEQLIVRVKESYDGALPSANSVAMGVFSRLARLTGDASLDERAAAIARAFSPRIEAAPTGHTHMLTALDFALGPGREIVLVGDPEGEDTWALVRAVREAYQPDAVTLVVPPGEDATAIHALAPFTASLRPLDGRATAFVCRGHACDRPTADPDELRRQLSA